MPPLPNYPRAYVNVAFTLMSILLKLACVSISRTIEFVIIGGRCTPADIHGFIPPLCFSREYATDYFEGGVVRKSGNNDTSYIYVIVINALVSCIMRKSRKNTRLVLFSSTY